MNRIYVGNLPFTSTEQELREAFGQHGEVRQVQIVTDRDSGRPRGFAFVEMADGASVQRAIEELNGSVFGGRTLTVNQAKERERRSRTHEDRRVDRGGKRDFYS